MKCTLLLCSMFLGISIAQKPTDCPELCDLESCAELSESSCIAEVVEDACSCCKLCAKVLNEPCGGELWREGSCGVDYICVGSSPTKEVDITNDETGICQCRELDQRVCGTDDVLYPNSCALNVESKRRVMAGRTPIETARDSSRCQYAPLINTAPKDTRVFAGRQVYLSCEVEGNPIPEIIWKRDGKKMPYSHSNVAVQVRGGPGKHQMTSWIMIDSTTEDSGIYQCHASNILGKTNEEANVVITKRPNLPQADNDEDLPEEPPNQI